jgi:RND family efflux transporter MFP subunit
MDSFMSFNLFKLQLSLLLGLSLLACEKPTTAPESAPEASKPALQEIQLSPQALKNSHLSIRTAGPLVLQQIRDFPGKIAMDQHRVQTVSSKLSGVAQLTHTHVGERVTKGELLAVIESRELADLRLEYIQRGKEREQAQRLLQREETLNRRIQTLIKALRQGSSPKSIHQQVLGLQIGNSKSQLLSHYSRLNLADQTYQREKSLAESQLATNQELQNARQELDTAKAQYLGALEEITWQRESLLIEQRQSLNMTESALSASKAKLQTFGPAGLQSLSQTHLTRFEIRAPLSGIVVEKQVMEGQGVQPDTPLFVVADLSEVWAEVQVYESELDNIHLGQSVMVRAEGLKQSSPGKISHVKPLVDEISRAAEAHAHIANPGLIWRPGMYVTVSVTEGQYKVPVAVDKLAIQQWQGKPVIFVKKGEHFQLRPVETGRSDSESIEIRKGLRAGESYVSKNSFVVKSIFMTTGEE